MRYIRSIMIVTCAVMAAEAAYALAAQAATIPPVRVAQALLVAAAE
ncbi:hypothetical protein HLH33_00615 [Gluconacetobacter diazotrophicus]|uniref:Uncharacterized protein n=1 Tax=Gluconacetobacter diazotrophicus TaxID=33996 RepID=A0A7W4FBW1_GLUDI|nr:hypothetical protein [Gluconacetobacter diazotrophicus]MBB2154822.1 hypothetical protein [Gluconacetobacter diazotrophicus]